MTEHMKTVELGSVTLTCVFADVSGEKSCEIVSESSREGIRMKEEDLHNIRLTAEEIWAELEEEE